MTRIPATERRASLVRSALTVIARDGVAAATTRAIVAEAGMPLSSFHYAVSSRDELLRDVIELVVAEEGNAALTSLLGEAPDARETIRLALSAYLEVVKGNPGREQAMFELTQYSLRTEGLADLPAEQYIRYHGVAEGLLETGARRLGIRWAIPTAELARLLVAITDGITLAWLADRDDAGAQRAIDLAADALMTFARPRADAEESTTAATATTTSASLTESQENS